MKRPAIVIAVIALIGTPALAADMAVKAPPPPPLPAPAYSWTGWYLGVNAGYGWNTADISATPNAVFSAPPAFPTTTAFIAANQPNKLQPNGGIGGGQVGYNWQITNWVLGLEADLDYFHSSESFAFGQGNVVPLNVSGEVSTSWLATVRPRLGIAIDRVLVYATGGWAFAHMNYSESVFVVGAITGPQSYSANITETRSGWTFGGGVEWAFAPNLSAKAEYLHMDFGAMSAIGSAVGASPGIAGRAFTFAADLRTNIVRAGLNYKF